MKCKRRILPLQTDIKIKGWFKMQHNKSSRKQNLIHDHILGCRFTCYFQDYQVITMLVKVHPIDNNNDRINMR